MNDFSFKALFRKEWFILFSLMTSLPFFLFSGWVFYRSFSLKSEEKTLKELTLLAEKTRAKRLQKETFIQKHSGDSDSFIEKQFAPLSFLEKEQTWLDNGIKNPAYSHDKKLQKRFDFLKNSNRLLLTLAEKKEHRQLIEKEYKLKEDVEIDTSDLETIVSLIEGKEESLEGVRPQMFFKEFHLMRDPKNKQKGTYLLDFTLVTREFQKEEK